MQREPRNSPLKNDYPRRDKWNESTSGQTRNRVPPFRIDFSREVDDPVFGARFVPLLTNDQPRSFANKFLISRERKATLKII